MLDVRRLRILREVASRGSFSAAAEQLYLSQSAVSQQVATLEREVGTRLLDRTRSGPQLTEAGRLLVSHADAVLCRLEEAERELAALAGLEGGELRMASFPSASATIITPAVTRFANLYPKVQVSVAEAEPEESLLRLQAGDLDLAIVFDYASFPCRMDPDLDRALLLTESLHLALPRDHRLADSRSVKLADLADEAWLCGVRPSSCGDVVLRSCQEAGFQPRIAFESDDYHVLQGYIAAGLGVTLLPDLVLRSVHDDVVVRPIVPKPPQRRVWAATRTGGSRSPATEAMLEVLAEATAGFEPLRAAA